MSEHRYGVNGQLRFWPLYISTIPGLAVGIWILSHSSGNLSRGTLGVVLLIYGAWGLWKGVFVIPVQWRKLLVVPVGIVTGMVNGATGSQILASHMKPPTS